MSRKSLTELANLHGTDKGTLSPVPGWPANHYTDVYEAYLERLRDSEITILEIGLGVLGERWEARIVRGHNTGGASLKMWYDYFPRARIYGIDVNPCPYLDNDRVTTFVADQGEPADLQAFIDTTGGATFDVIIDDGSHRPDHQQISLSFFFDKLNSGGLYFVEDLAANGRGDGARGRHACDSVLNTRSVLRHFRDRGEFPRPNALTSPDYLARHIAGLTFHVPTRSAGWSLGRSLRRPLRKWIRCNPGTELLCAMRKK